MPKMYMTYSSGLVLGAIANGFRYGFDVMEATGLASGTVYPAMRKLERVGYVRADWEGEDEAHRAGRPARRYYEITGSGAATLSELVKRFPGLERALTGAEA